MQWVLFSQTGYKSSFVSDADTKRSWVVVRQKYMQRQRITSFGAQEKYEILNQGYQQYETE